MKEYIKPLAILFGIIFISSAMMHLLSHSETLSEYVAKNSQSESQQASQSGQDEKNPDEDPAPEESPDESLSETAAAPEMSSTQEIPSVPETDPAAAGPEPETSPAGTAGSQPEAEDVTRSFYYEPLPDQVIKKITGVSYEENENISLEDLRYMHILHYNFDAEVTEGELICNKAIADDLLEIFYELYLSEYKIEKVRLIDEYGGDDTASMEDNNTSCFNYRVVDGTTSLSKHAYGLAIDINPFYNPYVVFQPDGDTYISPKGSEDYADRSTEFPYKINDEDLCYKLFMEHGFVWGGNWNSCKDYQHFQKTLN